MTLILVTDREGRQHALDAAEGDSLMVALRDAGLPVEGICGGTMACGTCHIHVLNAVAGQLPPVSADEAALLADLPGSLPHSRLSCQIRVSAASQGLSIVIAPDD